jgi:hypothetical protein
MSHCHCSRCRKTHGTAFASFVSAPAKGFRLLRGEAAIVRFESHAGGFRTFCRRCGSVVPIAPQGNELVFMPAGGLEGDPGVRPVAHIFMGSKAPWYEIRDQVARFDAYPPGVDAPVLPDLPLPPAEPGTLRGSCLCGGVAYAIRGEIQRIHNCHCQRCRRARGAAHATNLFVAADALRFTRGEELLESYKIPEAQRFTQVFCRVCGSKLPRVDRERGYAVVPMGSLDDDPGRGPERHIFVGSKAPWFEIADDLPQNAEGP